jgi:hypothetical protein
MLLVMDANQEISSGTPKTPTDEPGLDSGSENSKPPLPCASDDQRSEVRIDPEPAVTDFCHCRSANWLAIAAWCQGSSHQVAQLPCQDRAGLRHSGYDTLIGAVCDGAGSAKHAEIGAGVAVEAALKALDMSVRQYLGDPEHSSNSIPSDSFVQGTKDRLLAATVGSLEAEANKRGEPIQHFATTLAAFIWAPRWLLMAQIGDSFVIYRTSDFQVGQYRNAFMPARGEYANETYFLTDTYADDYLQVALVDQSPTFVAASTDGMASLMLNLADWTVHNPIFERLETILRAQESRLQSDGCHQDAALKELCGDLASWLASDAVVRRTDDDKSLVLAIAHEPGSDS